jgi:hypothetical protein
MLRPSTHEEYQAFVKESLLKQLVDTGQTSVLFTQAELIAKMWLTDLTPVASLVAPCYSTSSRGAPPRDPVCLFRSLLLIRLAGYTGITKWVQTLKSFPFFAILSGFEPGDVPGVGTFYDFINRLWKTERKSATKIRKPFSPRRRRGKKNEKLPLSRPNIVDRMVKRILRHEGQPLPMQPEDVLNAIFQQVFVEPSGKKGLLGDASNLVISGDGTPVRTGANPYGNKVCDCKSKGIYNCRCPRRYSDPEASWGWDSYRGCYFYGRHLYELTAASSPYDLPIYLKLVSARRHDSVSFVVALDEMTRRFKDFSFAACLLDSAHDAYPIYELLNAKGMEAVIDLNKRSTGKAKYQGPLCLTKDGIPLCPAGHVMAYHGFCRDRQRHKWRCPLTRKTWNVICDTPCSSSSYGRVIYTYEKDNLRFFTRTPRGSALWKKKYKERTASERSFKRKKIDYCLEASGARSTKMWFFCCIILAMCQHIDAWTAYEEMDFKAVIQGWIRESEVKAA